MPVIVKYSDELYHYGIKGQKWGVRRFQNPDGSYTPEGLKRYGRTGFGKKKITQKTIDKINAIASYKNEDSPEKKYKKILSTIGVNSSVFDDLVNRYEKDSEERVNIDKEAYFAGRRIYKDKEFMKDATKIKGIANALATGYTDKNEIKEDLKYFTDPDAEDDHLNELTYYAYKNNLSKHYNDLLVRRDTAHPSGQQIKDDIKLIEDRLKNIGINDGQPIVLGKGSSGPYTIGYDLRILIDEMASDYGKGVSDGRLFLEDFAAADDPDVRALFKKAEKLAKEI